MEYFMSYFPNQITSFNPANQSAFGVLEADPLSYVFQGDFIYGINSRLWQRYYVFTVTDPAADPVAGDIYQIGNSYFVVVYNSGTTLLAYGSGGAPAASGNLVRVSGSGTNPIAYSAYTTQSGVTKGTGASIDTNDGRLRIQGGTSSDGYAYLPTRRAFRYRAGQGTTVKFTPVFSSGVADNDQLLGVGSMTDGAVRDGYFFGFRNTNFGIFHYRGGSLLNFYTQAGDWNGDKCNGSAGASFTLNPLFGTPMMIKYPYLGYGDILFFIQRPADGAWRLCHTIPYANTTAITQLANPSLHFLGLVKNSGNTTNKIIYAGSIGVAVNGIIDLSSNPDWGHEHQKNTITAETNLLSIRNALTYNGVPNHGMIRLHSLSFDGDNNTGTSVLRIKINAAIGGTQTFTPKSGSSSDNGITLTNADSVASIDTAGTTVAGGQQVYSLTVNNPGTSEVDLLKYNLYISAGEVATFSGFSTAAASLGLSVNWSEDI